MTTVTSSGRETSYRSDRGERFGGGCSGDDDAAAAEAVEDAEDLPPAEEEAVAVVVAAVRGVAVGRSGNGVAANPQREREVVSIFDQPSPSERHDDTRKIRKESTTKKKKERKRKKGKGTDLSRCRQSNRA